MCSEQVSTELPDVAAAEPLIRVTDVSKCYRIYRNPLHRLWQGVIGSSRKLFREFWALNGVSLEVYAGETVGIVGCNGSGKSTLLQLIAGTLEPTQGAVELRGRVAALLELGSGFNLDFTGKENVYLNASILGLSRVEIDQRYAAIEAFADIGDFIDQPVSMYSSGMIMRLAFAVMANVDAEILIIDEALSVGDAFFTQKCMRFLRDFKLRGTLLFVSHDSSAVTGLCDRAIWLHEGRQQLAGSAKDVVNAYLEAFIGKRQGGDIRRAGGGRGDASGEPSSPRRHRDFRSDLLDRSQLRNDIEVMPFDPDAEVFGILDVQVLDVALLDEHDQAMTWVVGGESVVLEIVVEARQATDNLIVGFYVRDRLGQMLFGDNTALSTLNERAHAAVGETFRARFDFDMPRLQAGDYFITVGVAAGSQQEHVVHSWLNEALRFRSQGLHDTSGIIGIPMHAITLERE